jgi:hypothetical protein
MSPQNCAVSASLLPQTHPNGPKRGQESPWERTAETLPIDLFERRCLVTGSLLPCSNDLSCLCALLPARSYPGADEGRTC